MSIHLGLLKGKLQLCAIVGGCAISGCTIPVFAAYSGGVGEAEDVFKKIPADPLKLKERGDALANEYNKQLKDIKPEDFADLKKLEEQYTGTKGVVKTASQLVKEHHDAANYYLFEYGELVRGAFRWVPEILSSSIEPDEEGGAKKLSVQKIYAIATDDKFKPFALKMKETLGKHAEIVTTLNQEEADMVMGQFKLMEGGKISPVLEQITKNADNMDNDYGSCRSMFFLHLFTGKDSVEKTIKTLETIKTTIEAMKGKTGSVDLEGLDGVNDSLDESLEKLKRLSCQDTTD